MVTKKRFWIMSCLLVLLNSYFVYSARAEEQSVNDVGEILEVFSYDSVAKFEETQDEYDARMKWWVDARFGLFVHWGPVSVTGTMVGWSRGGERRDGYGEGSIPEEIYDNLYKHFLPSEYDAKEWVKMAKDAGMKYIVFVTKHHDGFCMWDTQLTDYKITSPLSPYGRDIAGELAEACHEADIKLIWYFSLGDWHHPDYYTENHERFDEYTLGQIRELCTNYGKIYGFWFDLAYTKMPENNMGEKISNLIHHLQPGAIINNRGGLKADYDTPEQSIGAFQGDRRWESCVTIAETWTWNPKDKLKSFEDCIYILVNTVGGDGNLLLNVGPLPDGRIEPKQVDVIKQIGKWMDKYSQSIYGTRGGPFMPGDYGSCTYKNNKIYLHVLNWDGQTLTLPTIDKKIVKSSLMTGGKVKVKQNTDEIIITVDKKYQKVADTIVVLEVDGPAGEIKPVITALGSMAFRKKAKASGSLKDHEPAKAFDGDDQSYWTARETKGWLEVDLGKTRKIAQALIYEPYPGKIRKFQLQCKIKDSWETVYDGIELGAQVVIRFKPVEARYFRLNITEAENKPSIAEIKLTGPIGVAEEEYKLQGTLLSDEVWNALLDGWIKVGASSVHMNMRQYGPEKLFEGGRWIPKQDEVKWLDIDFGHKRTINQAEIVTNRYWKAVKDFELQHRVNNSWKTFYKNEDLAKTAGNVKLNFDPLTLSQLRMKVTMDGVAHLETYKLTLSNTNEKR